MFAVGSCNVVHNLGNCCLQRALDCGYAFVPDCAERQCDDMMVAVGVRDFSLLFSLLDGYQVDPATEVDSRLSSFQFD